MTDVLKIFMLHRGFYSKICLIAVYHSQVTMFVLETSFELHSQDDVIFWLKKNLEPNFKMMKFLGLSENDCV